MNRKLYQIASIPEGLPISLCLLMGNQLLKHSQVSYALQSNGLMVKLNQSLMGFKKLRGGNIAVLEIPKGAKVVYCGYGKKLRASKATVLNLWRLRHLNDTLIKWLPADSRYVTSSLFDSSFLYYTGKKVKPRNAFSVNLYEQCESGIHFYLSVNNAKKHTF